MTLYDLKLPANWPFTAILNDREVAGSAWPTIAVDANWLQGDGAPPPDASLPERSLDDISRVILTSGSTGIPKGVVFTHRAWEQRIAHFDYVYGELAMLRRMMCCVVTAEHRYCLYSLSRGRLYCFADSSIESTARKIATHKIPIPGRGGKHARQYPCRVASGSKGLSIAGTDTRRRKPPPADARRKGPRHDVQPAHHVLRLHGNRNRCRRLGGSARSRQR